MQFHLPEPKRKKGINFKGSWNPWFAWHPVIATSGYIHPRKVLVWMETVERKVNHQLSGTPEERDIYEYRTT